MNGSTSAQFVAIVFKQNEKGLFSGLVARGPDPSGRDHRRVSCSQRCCGGSNRVFGQLHVDSFRADFDIRTMAEAKVASSRLGGGLA